MSKTKMTIPTHVKHIHCIGIGGAGMYPVVQILMFCGYKITGSDSNEGAITGYLRKAGVDVAIGHDPKNIEGADLIMYTDALLDGNVEIEAAKQQGVEIWERARMLGVISSRFDNAIAICGTHGKTTTTALLTHILYTAETSPTAVVGGMVPCINGYAIHGQSQNFVYEACEYKDHFLQSYPDTVVLLNIDNDHMEYFGTIENAIKSYTQFCNKASKIIYNGDDENVCKAIAAVDQGKELYSFGLDEKNEYSIEDITQEPPLTQRFEIVSGEYKEYYIYSTIKIPGKHNILNAAAAIIAAKTTGVKNDDINRVISNFNGVGRRFQILGRGKQSRASVVDDYAHHPTELIAVLNTAKEIAEGKVVAVFQPFTFTRTEMLLDEFAEALNIADEVVLTPIMGGREVNKTGISSHDLAKKIKNVTVVENFTEVVNYVGKNTKVEDMIITLGCGDIYKCAAEILFAE